MNWTGANVFQEIFVPLCALFGLRAMLRTWKGRVPKVPGALGVLIWWAAASAIALPDLTVRVAAAVGIGRGADLVFYLAILAGVSVCFYFYQRNRQLENLITELVRREALRNAQFRSSPIAGELQATDRRSPA